MAADRHVPPSRLRYESSHPTVSARVSKRLFREIKALKERSGKSVADVLREALATQAPSAKEAFDRGFKRGSRETERRFRVDYRCSQCGGTITVTTAEEKRAAAEAMRERGWAHSTCLS